VAIELVYGQYRFEVAGEVGSVNDGLRTRFGRVDRAALSPTPREEALQVEGRTEVIHFTNIPTFLCQRQIQGDVSEDEFSLYEFFATTSIGLINGAEGCPC
jgi:hypothetical protein